MSKVWKCLFSVVMMHELLFNAMHSIIAVSRHKFGAGTHTWCETGEHVTNYNFISWYCPTPKDNPGLLHRDCKRTQSYTHQKTKLNPTGHIVCPLARSFQVLSNGKAPLTNQTHPITIQLNFPKLLKCWMIPLPWATLYYLTYWETQAGDILVFYIILRSRTK